MPALRDLERGIVEAHAETLCRIRPHGAPRWQPPGVMAAYAKVAHLDAANVLMAGLRLSQDRTAATPAQIGIPSSECWREKVSDWSPTTKATYCPTHQVQLKAGICPSCRADQLAADDDTPPPSRGLPADQITSIVSELRDIAHATTTHQEDPR